MNGKSDGDPRVIRGSVATRRRSEARASVARASVFSIVAQFDQGSMEGVAVLSHEWVHLLVMGFGTDRLVWGSLTRASERAMP